MKELIMCYLGETALKGLNKSNFEARLMREVRRRTESCGNFKTYKAQSVFYVEPADEFADTDRAFDRVKKIFGFTHISKARIVEKDMDKICKVAPEYCARALAEAKTFKVAARRSDKEFPLGSLEISKEVGHWVLEAFPHLEVDVKKPDVTVMVEIRDKSAYVHTDKVKARGGVPVGTSGRGALMLSGGIDSPVAAYMMAKRGMDIMSVHFASPPYTSERARGKVITLAEKLTEYTGDMNLFIVPFTEAQEYIRDNGVEDLFTILMRRSMLRITARIAEKYGAQAIVTGESLGQVASQTIGALAITDATVDMPIFRPCIGMDKIEISDIARNIDTFETSILPYEDCCTIFTPSHPKTKPKMSEILTAEEKMDMTKLARLEEKARSEREKIFIKLR